MTTFRSRIWNSEIVLVRFNRLDKVMDLAVKNRQGEVRTYVLIGDSRKKSIV